MIDIVNLREVPCGAIAKSFKPYPTDSSGIDQTNDDEAFPVCKHGGWQECGLQSEALCAANVTGDELVMSQLINCHFEKGAAGGAGLMSPTIGADCALELGLDYDKIFACAFEGQYPVPYGLGLLLGSFNEQNERGVKATPTVMIDGTPTETWGSTANLLEAICGAYTGSTPPAGCASSNILRIKSLEAAAPPAKVLNGCSTQH